MLRRDFLKLCFLTASAASLPTACASRTTRYRKPETSFGIKDALLLTHVHLVDVRTKRLFPENALVIRDGRIEARLHLDDKTETPDLYKMNLGGAYLTPGLINSHCHMTLPGGLGIDPALALAYRRQVWRNAEECVKHGVTTVRDMLAVSDWLFRLRSRIDNGSIVGPRILRSCALEVKNGYGDMLSLLADPRFFKEIQSPKQARMAVRQAVEEGADFLKIFQQSQKNTLPIQKLARMDVATMTAIREEADRHRLPVALHQTEADSLRMALEAGIPQLEHMPRDRELTDDEIRRAKESGAVFAPTLSATFGLSQPRMGDPYWGQDPLPWLDRKREALLPPLLESFLEPEFAKASLVFYRELQDPKSYEQKHVLPWPDQSQFTSGAVVGAANALKLYRAGVPFLCGNDGGIPFAFPGAMGLELYLLEHVGFHPADLLQMVTYNNAKAMHLDRDIGLLEEGRLADLAVFSRDPLTTTRHMLEPLAVFQAGSLSYVAEGYQKTLFG